MAGLGKKPALCCSREFAQLCDGISKAALVDALWNACQLGTNESAEEIETQAARNIYAALSAREDRIPKEVNAVAARRIDSDPE
jgi:FixJ family two-component response regulator